VIDHIKCYKIKDSLKLKGVVVDLDSPQFGLEPGCAVRKARKFCVPVKKTVTATPVPLLPIAGQNLVDDYICYLIKCKTTAPPETRVEDQFGNRTVSKFKAFELCTPARKVP